MISGLAHLGKLLSTFKMLVTSSLDKKKKSTLLSSPSPSAFDNRFCLPLSLMLILQELCKSISLIYYIPLLYLWQPVHPLFLIQNFRFALLCVAHASGTLFPSPFFTFSSLSALITHFNSQLYFEFYVWGVWHIWLWWTEQLWVQYI